MASAATTVSTTVAVPDSSGGGGGGGRGGGGGASDATSRRREYRPCLTYFDPDKWSFRYATTYFTFTIPSHSLSSDGSHVDFNIELLCGKHKWIVKRRFSEFDSLKKTLSKSMSTLPPLPPKTWTRSHKVEDAFLVKRQGLLQAWLRDMLRRPSVLDMDAVREFLELDKHVPVVSKAAGEGVAAAATS